MNIPPWIKSWARIKLAIIWAITKLVYSAIAVLLVFIVTIPNAFIKVKGWVIPREQSWKETVYLDGIRIPIKLIEDESVLKVIVGSDDGMGAGLVETYSIQQLKDTVDFKRTGRPPPIIMPGGDTPFGLRLLYKNGCVLIGADFKDINDKYLGKMNFNEWELRSSYISNYHDGDDNMEIIDSEDHVLFNMKFVEPNSLIINGYYVTDNAIQIASFRKLSGSWKRAIENKMLILEEIGRIPKLNKY